MLTPRGKLIIPEKYLPLLGVGAAVAATLTYILWGPDSDGRGSKTATSTRRTVSGLENLGNTCYLNTILQSLAACPAFVKWLSRALRQGFFRGKHNELAYKLSKTIEVVNDQSASHDGSQVYSPHEVLHALYGCNWRADKGQQDAHELFQFLLSVLGEEKEPIPLPVPLCEASRLIEPRRNGLTSLHPDLHSNIEANLPKVAIREGESPFRGLLANHLSCTVCGHKNPVTYSSFDCLTLPIPATVFGTLTLESILAKFIQRELVHDVECTECAKQLAGKTTPPPDRTGEKMAPTASRRITPPTPKRVPTASIVSFIAPPTIPVAPPSSAIAPPASPEAPPTSDWVSPTSPIALPARVSSSTSTHPAPAEAPPTLEQAPPTCGQNGIDFHVEASPSKELPSDPSMDTSDQMRCEKYSAYMYASSEASEDNKTAVHGYHGSNNLVTDASSTPVASMEKLQERHSRAVGKSTDICNGSSEMSGSNETLNLQSNLRQNGAEALDLTKRQQEVNEECLMRNFEVNSTFDSIEEETRREQNERAPESQSLNGDDEDLAVGAQILPYLSVNSATEIKKDHEKSQVTSHYLPNGKHVGSENDEIRRNIPHSSNIPHGKCADLNTIAPRQNSSSALAHPKHQSFPKPQQPPLRSASPTANRIGSSEATPTMSIFGKIPGTDGVTPADIDQSPEVEPSEELSPKCRRMFQKQLTLGKLPQCLCIHLQRVTWLANGLPSRREEQVIFPEYLDMSPYKQTAAMSGAVLSGAKLLRLSSDLSEDGAFAVDTLQTRTKSSPGFIGGSFLTDPVGMSLVGGGLGQMSPRISHHAPGGTGGMRGMACEDEAGSISDVSLRTTEAKYQLASAVVHLGDAFSGHFLTFRRVPPLGNEPLGDNWLCISDESVNGSTPAEVFSQKAYMLYYQRT